MEDEHDRLHQHDEHGKDRNDDVVVGDASSCVSARSRVDRHHSSQLRPDCGNMYGSVIGVGVEYLIWIAVEAIVRSVLP